MSLTKRDETAVLNQPQTDVEQIRVDLHVHTCYSFDSLTSLKEVIEVSLRRGLGALAITDHDTISGALALQCMAPFTVIIGEEISTSEGEIIGLFLREHIPPGLTAAQTVAHIKEQGGMVYIPHPFDAFRGSGVSETVLLSILKQIDAIEVLNARVMWPAYNTRAMNFAQDHGLLSGAGSDAHAPFEIGRAYVEMEPFTDKDSFLRNLAGAHICGGLSWPHVHLLSTWAKMHKRRCS